ncbi:phosphate ABC transporter membrane protein 1, PhoT family [Magnetococcus marinus MC-1]|uniref:Phosphate transport system permease protein n=1 Tax=Magnetococcus marinus (strain ATCC BAA-1437 / JCM 17883 / MC-1) TaxID=156889 RepID=A0L7V5_MAGMM|nr:phosphate ABC transporter permease subunit PstC [Magnetococcus marinus]ABK44048.1 phosphate ABC transporter membrane protein 1, PhoT family [Magnetococcus marinus MC-1]
MTLSALTLVIVLLAMGTYMGRRHAFKILEGRHPSELHSRPNYHGAFVGLYAALPGAVILMGWLIFEPDLIQSMVMAHFNIPEGPTMTEQVMVIMNKIKIVAAGGQLMGGVSEQITIASQQYNELKSVSFYTLMGSLFVVLSGAMSFAYMQLGIESRVRNKVEKVVRVILIGSSTLSILVTLGIVLSLMFEAILFFGQIPPTDFLFGLQWSPQTALRADQVGGSGSFGAIPLFAGTLMITLIAMLVAAPIGLLAAVFMSEYATPLVRAWVKPVLEILAGVPTVVYGFFAALTVAPFLSNTGQAIGLHVASESALAAGLVMGIMIIPFVSSLSDDVINAVPQSLRDGSYGLGATKAETIKQVILPAALPGIVGALLLAVSRAIGETMIVVMAAGAAAKLSANPLESMTTVTVQIVTLLVGDQEFDSAKTLSAFALGLTLFGVTLILNFIALRVVQKYREQYD